MDGIVGLLKQSCDVEDVLLADEVVVVAGLAVEPKESSVKCLRTSSHRRSFFIQSHTNLSQMTNHFLTLIIDTVRSDSEAIFSRGKIPRSTIDLIRRRPSPTSHVCNGSIF